MDQYKQGIDVINEHVKPGCIYVQSLQMFGDTLHTSVIVNHLRAQYRNSKIVWGIGERYADEYKNTPYAKIIALPHVSSDDSGNEIRRKWVAHAKTLTKKVIAPCVGPFGYHGGATNIADAFLANAGILRLNVQRRPVLMLGAEDHQWADQFAKDHNLIDKKYAAIEYRSYSLSYNLMSLSDYEKLISLIKMPVVYIAGKNEPELAGGIDARGCTYRQAKALIMRSSVFIGCGSGLTMLAASDQCDQQIYEVGIGDPLNMHGCGYSKTSKSVPKAPEAIAMHVNKHK